jgi:hypothetical protein
MSQSQRGTTTTLTQEDANEKRKKSNSVALQ